MEEREYETMAGVEDRHFWFVGTRAMVKDAFLAAGVRTEDRVLDIGCGTGGTMRALHGLAGFVGMDMNKEATRLARRSTGNPVVKGSATAQPFEDGSFDCIMALDVFEHIPDDALAVAETRRVLRPGGTLITTVPCHQSLFSAHDEALHHVRRYSRRGFIDLLESGGFEPRRVTWTNSLLFPVAAGHRWLSNALRRKGHEPKSDASVRLGPMNGLLTRIFMLERRIVARTDMPFGLSLLVVCR